jgi:hypothetical protein
MPFRRLGGVFRKTPNQGSFAIPSLYETQMPRGQDSYIFGDIFCIRTYIL